MSQSKRRVVVKVFAVIVGAAASPYKSAAQEPIDALTPRAIADSTYAVRVAIDALAQSIRHGELDLRQFNDPELTGAVAQLATAAAGRARRPPHPDLGVLWDLQLDIAAFQPEGRNLLRVQTRPPSRADITGGGCNV
jgi:hypothetical protein